MSNMSQIPRETSDVMAASLGPTSTKNLADSLPFRESQEDILWRAIFKTDGWINKAFELGACPALVGPKLHEIGKPSYRGSNRHHILLTTNDYGGDLQYSSDLLLQSLREGYSYDSTKFTVILPETNFVTRDKRKMKIPEIALYVKDAIWPDELHYLSKRAIRRLFEKRTVRTQYSFASQKEICTVQSPAVYGLGGRVSNTEQLLPICGMYLFCHGKKWETFLYGPKCPPVSPIDGYRHGERHRVIGWRTESW
jgi:hypothetical protein